MTDKQHFNNLTPAEDERLALLAEEASEVIKNICKISRHGYESRDPINPHGPTNRELLEYEIGDFIGIVNAMTKKNDINEATVIKYSLEKWERSKSYLHHQEE